MAVAHELLSGNQPQKVVVASHTSRVPETSGSLDRSGSARLPGAGTADQPDQRPTGIFPRDVGSEHHRRTLRRSIWGPFRPLHPEPQSRLRPIPGGI